MRSSNGGPEFGDDGLSSDEGEGEGESDSALEDEGFVNDIYQLPSTPPPPPESRTMKTDSSSTDVATPAIAGTMKTPIATVPAVP